MNEFVHEVEKWEKEDWKTKPIKDLGLNIKKVPEKNFEIKKPVVEKTFVERPVYEKPKVVEDPNRIYSVDIGKRVYEPSLTKQEEIKREEVRQEEIKPIQRPEKSNVDYNQIRNIMTNKFGTGIKASSPSEKASEKIEEPGHKSLSEEAEKELIDKILKNKFNLSNSLKNNKDEKK
jgi:hypothetical protein